MLPKRDMIVKIASCGLPVCRARVRGRENHNSNINTN